MASKRRNSAGRPKPVKVLVVAQLRILSPSACKQHLYLFGPSAQRYSSTIRTFPASERATASSIARRFASCAFSISSLAFFLQPDRGATIHRAEQRQAGDGPGLHTVAEDKRVKPTTITRKTLARRLPKTERAQDKPMVSFWLYVRGTDVLLVTCRTDSPSVFFSVTVSRAQRRGSGCRDTTQFSFRLVLQKTCGTHVIGIGTWQLRRQHRIFGFYSRPCTFGACLTRVVHFTCSAATFAWNSCWRAILAISAL